MYSLSDKPTKSQVLAQRICQIAFKEWGNLERIFLMSIRSLRFLRLSRCSLVGDQRGRTPGVRVPGEVFHRLCFSMNPTKTVFR